MLPAYDTRFEIKFDNGVVANAVHIHKDTPPEVVAGLLNLTYPTPAIFLTGGAGGMSQTDIERTEAMLDTVALFAQQQGATVVDGGTASGIMQMIGKARTTHKLNFPLIGICPITKVQFPGFINPQHEAILESHHTHFIFVEGNEWGDESGMILGLTRTLSGSGKLPGVGILINGGEVSRQEVFLAATKSELKMPMLIVEDSGRAAHEIATAFKTGRANQRIMQAILAGGDIQLVSTIEGTDVIRSKLEARFFR